MRLMTFFSGPYIPPPVPDTPIEDWVYEDATNIKYEDDTNLYYLIDP